MVAQTYQVAIRLDSGAFETLKRLSAKNRVPYSTVISLALACLENTAPPAASPADSASLVVYGYLPGADRQPIKDLVRQFRREGRSFSAISKFLYRQHRLAGTDGLPLGASTIRGMCSSRLIPNSVSVGANKVVASCDVFPHAGASNFRGKRKFYGPKILKITIAWRPCSIPVRGIP